jgi:hypothetical protein
MAECYVRYAFKVIAHMQRTNILSFSPKLDAIEEYYIWTHELMKRLTLSNPCYSWFKAGKEHGPVTAVYAGSRAHFYEAMKEPRYEDYDIKYEGNRFSHYGNGFSAAEATPDANRVWYLDELRRDHAEGKDAYEIVTIRPLEQHYDTRMFVPMPKEAEGPVESENATPNPVVVEA